MRKRSIYLANVYLHFSLSSSR
uniref:Uncharacterized protein n=1 Tax=Anguilla anguilla TaxID=7936 RepID=A0A0E9R1U5_ANGAN